MINRSAYAPHTLKQAKPESHRLASRLVSLGFSALAFMSMLFAGPLPEAAADISYVYDNLGRVLAVIDPANYPRIWASACRRRA